MTNTEWIKRLRQKHLELRQDYFPAFMKHKREKPQHFSVAVENNSPQVSVILRLTWYKRIIRKRTLIPSN